MKKKVLSIEHQRFLNRRTRSKAIVLACQLGLLVLFLGLWELMAAYEVIDSFITSSPSRIWATFIDLAKGDLWRHALTTLAETVVAFLLSFLIGTTVAVLLWLSDGVRRVLEPYLVVLNALPKIALGPIIIIWVGAGPQAIVTMALLISVIITTINTLTGFISTPKGGARGR